MDNFIKCNIPAGMKGGEFRLDIADFLKGLHCYRELKNERWVSSQMGTLGGANHFIEVEQNVQGVQFVTVHSGCRNLGKQVCQIYHKKFIAGKVFWVDYAHDLQVAQKFVDWNRKEIMQRIVDFFNLTVVQYIESIHNYFDGVYVRMGRLMHL